MEYLREFADHNAYDIAKSSLSLPNVAHCIQEGDVHYNPLINWADEYLTFIALGNGTFTFTPQNNNVISYSIDNGENWTEGNSVSVANGDKVMWKGTMTPTSSGIGKFSSTGSFDVKGNVMSLLFGDDFKNKTDLTGKAYAFYRLFYNATYLVSPKDLSLPATTLADYCYSNMFRGCISMTTSPELPATTLATYCYNYMFNSCRSLTTAPELPATTLADHCYYSMFYGCTNLTSAPELPATILAESCYYYMFNGCTSLTTAPELPATILANNCYSSMFYNCSNLTTAHELPATILANNCYSSMFYNCSNLTTAPELPATTLANNCYNGMFNGCTSLTTAPELPATRLVEGCYQDMFQGCTDLNYIKAMFTTTPSTTYTRSWVRNVSSRGTFVKNSSATWDVTGMNGIPTGWTVQTA